MGAVAALLYLSRNPTATPVKGCIYDSPFASLRKLVKELARQKTGIPEVFFEMFMEVLDGELMRKGGFCLEDLEVRKRVGEVKVPAVFISSEKDVLVKREHVEELFEGYQGEKYFERTGREHHEAREGEMVGRCVGFLKGRFGRGERGAVGNGNGNGKKN